MANFNSSFISNANIGNWDYYIFSDNVGIWRALNGLAAWFNSSGPLLQGAAWLGALIILAMAIFGAAVKKSTVSGGVLGTWFFFMSNDGDHRPSQRLQRLHESGHCRSKHSGPGPGSSQRFL